MLRSLRSQLSSKLEEKERELESFQKQIQELDELLDRATNGNILVEFNKRIGGEKAHTASGMNEYVFCIYLKYEYT